MERETGQIRLEVLKGDMAMISDCCGAALRSAPQQSAALGSTGLCSTALVSLGLNPGESKAWIEAVGDVVETCFNAKIGYLTQGSDLAVKRAKDAAGDRCEVTGLKVSRQKSLDLDGHHPFDRRSHPDLADLADNILLITPDLNQEFHSSRTGTFIPNDFLTFAEIVRADRFDPVNTR